MAITERQGITGRLTIVLREPQGKVLERRQVHNVITMAGKHLLANFFTGAVQAVPTLFIAVGADGDTAAEESNTELPGLLVEVPAEVSVNENVATVTATLPAKNGDEVDALREAGIRIQVPGWDAPVLYNRVVFPVVNKSGNMEMTLTWEVVF